MTITKMLRKYSPRLMALALTLVTMISLYVPASAASGEVLPDGIYVVWSMNKNTGWNIQYAKGSGGNMVTDPINGETNEIYIFQNVGGGYITIRPYHAKNCFLSGEKGRDGELILRTGYSSNPYYQWKPISVGNGMYVFQNRGTGLVVDCTNGNIDPAGTKYISYDRNGFDQAQSHYPVRISTNVNKLTPSTRVSLSQGTYSMRIHSDQNKAVNVGFYGGVGASIVVDTFNSELNEIVEIIPRGNNLVSIHFKHKSNLALAASDIFTDSPLTLKTYSSSDRSCLWEVYKTNDAYSFRNAKNLLMADDWCYQSADGTPIINFSYNENNAQLFYLKKTSTSSTSSSTTTNQAAQTTMTNALYGINTSASKLSCKFDGYVNTKGRHEGIDFSYGSGKNVYSLTDGVITRVTYGSTNSLSTIAIYQASTNKTIVYLHTAPISGLRAGQTISRGQKIATESNRAGGSVHTHVEVRDGRRTAAAKSVGDYVLENSNPTAYWNSQGYRVY